MISRLRITSLLVLAAAFNPAAAQDEEPRDIRIDHHFDSGWVSNDTDSEAVIIAFPVHIQTARSLRLYFDDIQLSGNTFDGTGSTLRITALRDDAIQSMNADHVAQWQNSSCYFNGNAVMVEVIAQPGTGPNRVALESIDMGLAWNEYESICGVDDRQPSNDPRVSRLLPVGCTSWLIDDCGKCYLTAGHCVGFINAVEYNVPFSTSGGSWNHPGPEDQYAVDPASIQSNGGGGVGNDYAYFGTFANSNTGLTAFEAQGDAFELVAPPSTTSGNTIRITGHGTDSTPNSTYNQVQQTHVGPLVGASTSSLQYATDTTGGNSGSPVIWEQTDQAIGIHTHGGCSSGANNGTAFTQSGLQSVLNNPQGVCALGSTSGVFSDLGFSKDGFFFGAPELAGCGSLQPASAMTLTLAMPFNLNGLVATRFIGLAQINAPFKGGTLVPAPTIVLGGLPLENNGPPGATLIVDAIWPAGIPSGTEIFIQDWVNVPFALGDELVASNALKLTAP